MHRMATVAISRCESATLIVSCRRFRLLHVDFGNRENCHTHEDGERSKTYVESYSELEERFVKASFNAERTIERLF